MRLSTSLVAVKKITSTVERSTFSEDDLNQAAKLILDAEGVINPIVVRRTSLESYEVVDGDFEYYAAAKAREIDPRKGEMIGTFIVEPENEEVIKEQVKAIRKQSFEQATTNVETEQLLESSDSLTLDIPPASNENKQIKSLFQQFEKSLEPKLEDINNNIAQLQMNFNNNVSSSSEAIDIKGLLKQLEKLIENNMEPLVKQIKEMDLKLNKFGYYTMTVAQLKAIAKERQIKERSKLTTKDKLVTAIIKLESSEN